MPLHTHQLEHDHIEINSEKMTHTQNHYRNHTRNQLTEEITVEIMLKIKITNREIMEIASEIWKSYPEIR